MANQIGSLSIEKKIGQLLFIGLPDAELSNQSSELLREISPGGICLFSRNIKSVEQVRRLICDVRTNLSIVPFISLDQEGGVVDRLRRILTPMPAASSLATKEDACTLAKITAEAVRMLGFNMNFAPVVDVVDDERAKFSNGLYSRAFGKKKETVVSLAGAYLKTLQAAGCIGCLKHFPGLGASPADSHENLPSVDVSETEFSDVDLFPYVELLETQDVRAVMIAHAAFPHSDLQETDPNGKLLPASLSHNFITKLLREKLNFGGLVITDDLEMGAIVENYGIGEACVRAVEAGVDMPLICGSADAVRAGFQTVLDAVRRREINEKKIDRALRRVAHLKNLLPAESAPFNNERWKTLSEQILQLNQKVNNQLGG
ncbi:MAG: glycoside hydrolase family 3 protein [Acidobacteria bacterium]|nr:glycoside hydrolase family 3 protein [Acidobacteriota bacterium]